MMICLSMQIIFDHERMHPICAVGPFLQNMRISELFCGKTQPHKLIHVMALL